MSRFCAGSGTGGICLPLVNHEFPLNGRNEWGRAVDAIPVTGGDFVMKRLWSGQASKKKRLSLSKLLVSRLAFPGKK
ncbi:hypothetical protein KNP414_05281 [Paenibacillus mucilaginosus KNP414]|uniref:Uncharacterized protein n=1 Tax=Paenibacillus mucilaginosus (strain KNP414) TaxID=1036673 RepID=F8FE46_PAEMK|nr:hypothetical protein KNP414_05281 [Paenibacillus mucilaginosus KNP414]